jgi:nicotinamide-nucleotide amidase
MVRSRRLLTAELLSIGSELTLGETRDTNAGDIARALTALGIAVLRIQAVRDDFADVTAAFRDALGRADLAISTGGLGPTPDDLTREAIAAVAGERPLVDPELEQWLRDLWTRRGMPMPELNLKQAWLIPSATALPNDQGTAPGWWVDRPDGRVVVALPGPPREMRPIWTDHVLPRLRARGVGAEVASRTFRLAGIGESAVADLLGEELLRSSNPVVATYARAEAVDVRVSARREPRGRESAPAELVEAAAKTVLDVLGKHVWAEGETTWAEAIEAALLERDWTLASVEVGTGGSFATLIGDRPWLRLGESLAVEAVAAIRHDDAAASHDGSTAADATATDVAPSATDGLVALAGRAMEVGGADVGIGIRARPRGADTAATVVVIRPGSVHRERRLVFLGGAQGRSRVALAAAAVLLADLRAAAPDTERPSS